MHSILIADCNADQAGTERMVKIGWNMLYTLHLAVLSSHHILIVSSFLHK